MKNAALPIFSIDRAAVRSILFEIYVGRPRELLRHEAASTADETLRRFAYSVSGLNLGTQ